MPLQDDYQVRLSNFEGPLDLLLFLIRRAEVDVNDIPIVEITGQYFDFLKQIDQIDIEVAGEFLVMAATLIEIKSRSLKPPNAEGQEDGPEDIGEDLSAIDPRFELVQQLLAYQRYRAASERLDVHRLEHSQMHQVQVGVSDEADSQPTASDEAEVQDQVLEIEDAHLGDLIEAYQRIVEAVDFGKMGDHEIEYDDTPIALHEEDLSDRLQRRPDNRLSLHAALEGKRRIEMIGLFLAVLELARKQHIRILQDPEREEILIELRDEADREQLPAEDGPEAAPSPIP